MAIGRLDKTDRGELDTWIHEAEKGKRLDDISIMDLKDRKWCENELFPRIRRSKAAIDFYLSRVVFTQQLREFPQKLSASGWNLARRTTHELTGFSGMCDSRYVLPLSLTHLELDEQRHTNASVLACLLRRENSVRDLKPLKGEFFFFQFVDQVRCCLGSSRPGHIGCWRTDSRARK